MLFIRYAFWPRLLFVIGIGAFLGKMSSAHHSFEAEFDIKKPLILRGIVTRMLWFNPHAWIEIDVKNPDGTTTGWMIESGSPNILIRRGFTKKSLEPGTEVVVYGYRAKNGENKANGGKITFKDGRSLFLGGSNPDDPSKPQDKP